MGELFLGRSVPMFRKLTATKRPKSSKTKLVKLKLRSNAVHCHLLCPLKKSVKPSGSYENQDYSSSQGRSGSVGHSSCHKKLETKCFTQPREVTMVNCFTKNERSCEYVNEPSPRVVYEDECREFEKRHCQMEQRPQKKQIKKYVYNIRCEPRTLRPCHTFNVAKMSTHCEPEFYDKCQVVPHEKCQEVPKEACFKEPVMVKRTKCSSDFSTTTSKLSENSFTADQY